MNYTKDFSVQEMACKCGRCNTYMNLYFMEMLQSLRDRLDKPLFINSAARCKEHNEAVGGVPSSRHIAGSAADIAVSSSVDRGELVTAAIEVGFGGIGVHRNYVHVDSRPKGEFPILWVYD